MERRVPFAFRCPQHLARDLDRVHAQMASRWPTMTKTDTLVGLLSAGLDAHNAREAGLAAEVAPGGASEEGMRHRHLVDEDFARRSPTAIDDIIARGHWADWARLRRWCIEQPSLLDVVERVCGMHVSDPGAQRHHFWLAYARARRHATS